MSTKHRKKITPTITRETAFSQQISEFVFGINIFDLDLGVEVHSFNNQFNASLWVLDTCLILQHLPLMTIFVTTSLSS